MPPAAVVSDDVTDRCRAMMRRETTHAFVEFCAQAIAAPILMFANKIPRMHEAFTPKRRQAEYLRSLVNYLNRVYSDLVHCRADAYVYDTFYNRMPDHAPVCVMNTLLRLGVGLYARLDVPVVSFLSMHLVVKDKEQVRGAFKHFIYTQVFVGVMQSIVSAIELWERPCSHVLAADLALFASEHEKPLYVYAAFDEDCGASEA